MIKEQKNEAIKQRKEKYQERKAALQVPLAPLPEKELCQYERIREKNIKEREKAMADSGFFKEKFWNTKRKLDFQNNQFPGI